MRLVYVSGRRHNEDPWSFGAQDVSECQLCSGTRWTYSCFLSSSHVIAKKFRRADLLIVQSRIPQIFLDHRAPTLCIKGTILIILNEVGVKFSKQSHSHDFYGDSIIKILPCRSRVHSGTKTRPWPLRRGGRVRRVLETLLDKFLIMLFVIYAWCRMSSCITAIFILPHISPTEFSSIIWR
jgi:hypothetical protein